MNIVEFVKGLAQEGVNAEIIYGLVVLVRRAQENPSKTFESGGVFFNDISAHTIGKVIPEKSLRDFNNTEYPKYIMTDEMVEEINRFLNHKP